MGSITSPSSGETKFIGETITITYDSGAFNFGNGTGEIDSLQYVIDGIPKATKIMQPADAPATHSYTLALPLSIGPTTIQVHARNANTMVLETVTITLNLIARPSATCTGADNQALDALDFTGNLAGIPAGGSARFRYGTVSGGPYPDTVAAAPYADGPVTGPVTGLSAGTVYYYVLEILDSGGTVVATSPQCSAQTLSEATTGSGCPVPPYVDDCPPKQVYSVGGTQYIAFEFCDSGNQQTVIAVFTICDGAPSGTPAYYDLTGAPYTPTGDVGKCTDAPDYEIMCDHGATPPARMIALWDATANPPALKYYQAAADGSLTDYTPIGPVGSCSSTDIEETSTCYVATVDGALGSGYSQGDILSQILFWDTSATPPILLSTAWRNQTTNALLSAAPVFSELAPCDGVPPRDCIPSSDVNVNRTDCAGGPVPPAVLTDLSPLSVNIDDPDMDGVCTDATSIAPEFFPAPFPVNEPVRTANSGMALFDGAILTAAAAIDPPGAGWLRLTNNQNSQRGGAIVQAPFPSTTGIEFEYTYAVYGKTAADGADGHSFMLLDGNLPLPVTMGAPGGALGYAYIGATPGIAGGVIGIGLDEFGNFSNPGANVTNTGPGFLPHHLTIRGAGNGTAGYPWLTSIDLQAITGETIDGHPRATPVKVRGSLVPTGGQMTLNLFLDFGAGYVQVVNNLLINQALPTQLRFGFSASTGGYNNYHEIRDIVAAPPSRRHWRAITPTFDDPPACATSLEGEANVTYTLTSDTQTQQGGDNDNEHFIGWALEDPVGTYTWLSQKWIKSAPTEVGVERTITLATGTLTPAQRSQLRLVLGAETVDLRGSYGIRYSLVETNLTAVGCPAETIKTMPISAPCPIPVTIVQGTGSGSGVNATVNTVEVEVICSDLGQIFRREVRDTSGTPKIDFMGQDGQAVSPSTWSPGPCADCECQRLIQPVCLRDSVTGDTRPAAVIYSFTSAGLVSTTSLVDHTGAVVTPTATEVVTLGGCESTDLLQLVPVCFALVATPTVIHTAYKVVAITAAGTTTLYYYESDTGAIHAAADVIETECVKDYDPIILCDDNGPFIRHYRYGSYGNVGGAYDTTLDGLTAYTPVGAVQSCSPSGNTLIPACDTVTGTTGATPGVCGVNQQTIDTADIQDAEQKRDDAINVNDNDLELAGTAEPGETDFMTAVRFTVNIPQGATVCAAHIQFTAEGTVSYGDLTARIEGEDQDASALFTTAAGMLAARTKTTAQVSWDIPQWVNNAAGAAQRTPDLSTIVQEVVDRAGWAANNAMAFFFTPTTTTGYRRASSIQDGSEAPKLHVEYVVDTPGGEAETTCVAFLMEIDGTGAATGNNYRINPATDAWEAYTPTGEVTYGDCACAGTPGAGETDFEVICLEDSTGTSFARLVALDGTAGATRVIGDYALDFSGQYTPVGTVAPCGSGNANDVEILTLCDDNGSFLRHIVYDSATGAVSSSYDTEIDGSTAYTTVGTIKTCQPEGKPCLTCRS